MTPEERSERHIALVLGARAMRNRGKFDLTRAWKHVSDGVVPASLKQLVADTAYRMPSAAFFTYKQVSLCAALSLHLREKFASTSGPLHLFADGSVLGKHNWLLCIMDSIEDSKLDLCFEHAVALRQTSACLHQLVTRSGPLNVGADDAEINEKLDLARQRVASAKVLSANIQRHRLVPKAVTNSEKVHNKVRALGHAIALFAEAGSSGADIMQRVRAVCVDRGCELSLADTYGSLKDHQPEWRRAREFHADGDQLQDEIHSSRSVAARTFGNSGARLAADLLRAQPRKHPRFYEYVLSLRAWHMAGDCGMTLL